MSGCIFCGRSPQTKTHVFRKAWIDRLMVPATEPFEMLHEGGDMFGARREGAWPVREFSMAPGAACAVCNNGWMDGVDRAAERIVEPMVVGRRATIRRYTDQKAVARWVSQVAILIDQTQTVQVIPPEITQRFYKDQEPLTGIIVWLAGTGTAWTVEAWNRAWVIQAGAPPEATQRPNMSLVTFRIVNLVVQALVPLSRNAGEIFGISRGDSMQFLKQLWPSRYTPVSWPPSKLISQDTLDKFARSFEPEGIRLGDVWPTAS